MTSAIQTWSIILRSQNASDEIPPRPFLAYSLRAPHKWACACQSVSERPCLPDAGSAHKQKSHGGNTTSSELLLLQGKHDLVFTHSSSIQGDIFKITRIKNIYIFFKCSVPHTGAHWEYEDEKPWPKLVGLQGAGRILRSADGWVNQKLWGLCFYFSLFYFLTAEKKKDSV